MNSYRITIPKQILILTAFTVALNVVRIIWSDSIYFIYLIWNIFLAYLPFLISSYLLWYKENNPDQNRDPDKGRGNKFQPLFFIFGGIVWLFLFPNAPYLVTDMIHLNPDSLMPLWYDALLLFSTAWVGILLTVHSLSHIENFLSKQYSKQISSFIFILTILASSFGIYLGRFLRWNSWDVIVEPQSIWIDAWEILLHPVYHIEAYIFTFSFFIFILVSYRAWKLR